MAAKRTEVSLEAKMVDSIWEATIVLDFETGDQRDSRTENLNLAEARVLKDQMISAVSRAEKLLGKA